MAAVQRKRSPHIRKLKGIVFEGPPKKLIKSSEKIKMIAPVRVLRVVEKPRRIVGAWIDLR